MIQEATSTIESLGGGDGADSAVRRVREEYARIAERGGLEDTLAGTAPDRRPCSERLGYDPNEIKSLPDGADMGLGCGAPVLALELEPGETVLDLGSGGGIDVFLAARQVGPEGRAIGVDMTPEMIEVARDNARRGGYDNVEFRQGRLEALPIEDDSVDAVTSNCVINLVPDKRAVYAEIARVLKPGGRTVVSDLVLKKPLPAALLGELAEGNCLVTAIERDKYLDLIRQAGLGEPDILREVDYLESVGWTDLRSMNEESRALLERAGVSFEEIRGSVRSITLRATKPGR